MTDWLLDHYATLKALHIIFVIYWMAGLLMIPRFFVYHFDVPAGSEEDQKWIDREARLFKIILGPAMHIAATLGIVLMVIMDLYLVLWFQIKIVMIVVMLVFHVMMSRTRKKFALGERPKSEKYYRMMNEVPSLLILGIVLMAVLKPFV